MIAAVIEWGNLLQVVYVSLIAGVGITFVWSLGIVGAARFDESRRAGNGRAAAGYALLGIVAGLVVIAVLVQAVIIMTTK